MDNNNDLELGLDMFLGKKHNDSDKNGNSTIECKDDVCIIKNDKSLIEVVNKKIITQDGRQLLT